MEMIPRAEYPRPQFERAAWLNLNGTWQFEIDQGRSGVARELYKTDRALADTITVPFCPESKLSGVQHLDFMQAVWYKRNVTLTPEQVSGKVMLHFGAVDWECTVYVNGTEAGRHIGGYTSFEFDITALVTEGENQIAVYACDDPRHPLIPRGKQSELYHSWGCDYTRTTGIWQTVWLEFMPTTYVKKVKYYPDTDACAVTMMLETVGNALLDVRVTYDGVLQAHTTCALSEGSHTLTLPLAEEHLWEVGNGRLYDVAITYGEDTVKSYFGLRTVRLDGMKFLINGKSVFQRLVLDQGFYPDGIYTAPSDEALQNDINMSLAMGFNGARLHEKVFEERFLYHCDRLGYLVWGEYANWGLDHSQPEAIFSILPEWMSEIDRDFNHPAIIGWCPYNETWDIGSREGGRAQHPEVIRTVYKVTKAMDPTRPCIDTSGNYHVETDIYDLHNYDQNPETFRACYDIMADGQPPKDPQGHRQTYRGEPFFVSEYGGIRWSNEEGGWGYGDAPKTAEEFLARLKGLTDALLDNPNVFGFCYTQLTDVEQEQNGLYTYDRQAKFDPAVIYPILSRHAAIED